MRPALRSSHPRHLAGSQRSPWHPREVDADFDVEAALDAESDYDFDALFAGEDDVDEAPVPRVRAARHRIAFAVSITIAAVPLLVLDNFQATAESPDGSHVEATAGAAKDELRSVVTLPERLPTSEVPPVEVTIAKATIYVGEPLPTSTTAAPLERASVVAPTTTAKPTTTTAKPTTTTAKPTTPTTAAPVANVVAGPTAPDPSAPSTWEKLAKCESGGNWQAVSKPRSGMQYYGGLQFSLTTWQGLGGTGYPHEASKDQQIEMGKKLQVRQGWKAWPTCARQLGWIS